jgi:hypothetical protein
MTINYLKKTLNITLSSSEWSKHKVAFEEQSIDSTSTSKYQQWHGGRME